MSPPTLVSSSITILVPTIFFLKVSAKYTDGTDYSDEFNTVVFAIGRDACTNNIGLDKIGVQLNPKNGKVRALIFLYKSISVLYLLILSF